MPPTTVPGVCPTERVCRCRPDAIEVDELNAEGPGCTACRCKIAVKISGTVVYSNGGPIEGARVNVNVPGLIFGNEAVTGPDGRYTLRLPAYYFGILSASVDTVDGVLTVVVDEDFETDNVDRTLPPIVIPIEGETSTSTSSTAYTTTLVTSSAVTLPGTTVDLDDGDLEATTTVEPQTEDIESSTDEDPLFP
jgi:hypothetical protein